MKFLQPFKDLGASLKAAAPTFKLFPKQPEFKPPKRTPTPARVYSEEELIRAAWRDVGDALRHVMGSDHDRP